jgi:alkanesulfonate monooxygenase SsuD/methylene tetrahydromethanopterin reductase-like flavin-dependent oxidoreductase (luciferase family)
VDAALRIGITPWRYDASAPASLLVEQAKRAESLGFHSFWLPESHFAGPGSNPSPLLWLAAVAGATTRLRVATTSYLLPVRHPIQAAEEVAVLDCLSGGRLILGVGRGFRRALFAAYDLPEGEKRDRFEAALAIMRDAWEGKPVAIDPREGGVILAPLPVQQPHPPIWAAAFGPKALALSGRLGLPYLCSPIEPFDQLARNYAAHREAVRESHGDVELPVPVMRTVFAHRDAAVLGRVRDGLERQAQAMASTASPSLRRLAATRLTDWALVGEPAQVADGIARYREGLGITHLVARTQIPGADESDTLAALDHLAELSASERA